MTFPSYINDRLFEERVAAEKRKQDAIDALDWLSSHGVVMSPRLFWHRDGGQTLIEAIKEAHEREIYEEMNR